MSLLRYTLHVLRCWLIPVATLAAAIAVFPQAKQPDAPKATPLENVGFTIPFDEWVSGKKHEAIPWRFEVSRPGLGFDQRLEFSTYALIESKRLTKLGEQHELYMIVRVGDEHGHWIEQSWLGMRLSQPPPKNSALSFRHRFFTLPGKYRIAAVLYDRITGLYSTQAGWMNVPPLKKDPLPNAFSSLPRVQAIVPAGDPEPRFLPGIYSRLSLPVKSERPIHFEIILSYPFTNFGFPLTALNVFSQLRPQQYSYHITVVDPSERQIVLEQKEVPATDWVALRETIRKINPGVVSATALEGSSQNLIFLRDVIADRLKEPLPDVAGKRPLKVMLVLGTPRFLLPRDAERVELAPELLGDTLFFQVRESQPNFPTMFRLPERLRGTIVSSEAFDHVLKDVLKTSNAKRFEVITPENFRSALAEIITAMEAKGKGDGMRATAATKAQPPL